MNIKNKIIDFMKVKDYIPMKKEELEKAFDIKRDWKYEFEKILKSMISDGLIVLTRKGKYILAEDTGLLTGVFQANRKGYGFLIPENREYPDIFIPSRKTLQAVDGDKVMVQIIQEKINNKKSEGKIIKIIERTNKKLVGKFEKSKNFGFVIPTNEKISKDIYISNKNNMNAKNNQIVEISITSWGDGETNPEGKIIDILGYSGEKGIDILTIIKSNGLSEEFPESVEKELSQTDFDIENQDISSRRDLRNELIFTIDGADAKDFDDAISIELKKNGNYQLGVHIADVSHYVRRNSEIDREAYNRGNSVYLLTKVIPMLPEKISNGICSLMPNEDRLCMTVTMEIDKKGKVLNYEIYESIINSKYRLIYDDISDILEKKENSKTNEYKELSDKFYLMEKLCHILYEKREKRGSIGFEFPETEIVLDENDKPIDIKKTDRRIANKLIEEFMLVTNETVAEHMHWSEIPIIYRIHENPDTEKIESFNEFIYNFGYRLKLSKDLHPKELQELLLNIRNSKEENLISEIMLRSLKKARYSSEAGYHFGLATEYYTHFTAPIRRYSDLETHRMIRGLIKNKIKNTDKVLERLTEIASRVSRTEKKADEIEREVYDIKKVEFMLGKIGEIYKGIISGVISSGFFVELDNTVEGFVSVVSMDDDYYDYDEKNYALIGKNKKEQYQIGDEVTIQVDDVNLNSVRIDFKLIKDDESNT